MPPTASRVISGRRIGSAKSPRWSRTSGSYISNPAAGTAVRIQMQLHAQEPPPLLQAGRPGLMRAARLRDDRQAIKKTAISDLAAPLGPIGNAALSLPIRHIAAAVEVRMDRKRPGHFTLQVQR